MFWLNKLSYPYRIAMRHHSDSNWIGSHYRYSDDNFSSRSEITRGSEFISFFCHCIVTFGSRWGLQMSLTVQWQKGESNSEVGTFCDLRCWWKCVTTSDGDADSHVFGPPGSGSITQRYGSRSSSGSLFTFLIQRTEIMIATDPPIKIQKGR